MKSKVTFDLDGRNNPILLVQAESTDDVRDKIATRFVANLGNMHATACLAYCESSTGELRNVIVRPYRTDERDTKEFVDGLNLDHRVTLFKALKKSLDISVSEGYLTEEYEKYQNKKCEVGDIGIKIMF